MPRAVDPRQTYFIPGVSPRGGALSERRFFVLSVWLLSVVVYYRTGCAQMIAFSPWRQNGASSPPVMWFGVVKPKGEI